MGRIMVPGVLLVLGLAATAGYYKYRSWLLQRDNAELTDALMDERNKKKD